MSDDRFAQDQERAARMLRAAVVSALTQGISETDVARIVAEGAREARPLAITQRSRQRAEQLGITPSGQPLPAPALRLVESKRPGLVDPATAVRSSNDDHLRRAA